MFPLPCITAGTGKGIVKGVDSVISSGLGDDIIEAGGDVAKGAGKVLSPSEAAKKIANAERVGSGLKGDTYHRAASYLSESQISKGTVFDLGKNNTLLQVEGSVNGKIGIFEYVFNKNGQVTHQLFKEGGVINGITN